MDVQHLIKASGTKQADLARALGVSEATVTRWVRQGFPSDRLAEVAAVTKIDPAILRPDLAALFRPAPSIEQARA